MKKISAIGSCRLDGLYERFSIHDVKNTIGYTHSSKEALQLIRYLKKVAESNSVDCFKSARWKFRSFILNPDALGNHDKIINAAKRFFESDIYVIEISSAHSYTIGSDIFHDLVLDNTIEFPDAKSLKRIHVSYEEMLSDIEAIMSYLGRNIVLVPHIVTKLEGERFELYSKLKNLCKEKNILFFDQRIETAGYATEKLYLNEPKIAHYTLDGQQIIGKLLSNFICKNFNFRVGIIAQMLYYSKWRFRIKLLNVIEYLNKLKIIVFERNSSSANKPKHIAQ